MKYIRELSDLFVLLLLPLGFKIIANTTDAATDGADDNGDDDTILSVTQGPAISNTHRCLLQGFPLSPMLRLR